MIRRTGAPAPRAYADTRYKTSGKIKTALYHFACRAARHNYPRKRRRLPRNICACRFLLARKSRFRYNRDMKVFAISDLHLSGGIADKPMDVFGTGWQGYMEKIEADWRQKVSKSDVVLLAGDLSWGMNMRQAAPDIARVAALPGKKVIIRGNHDYWWRSLAKVRAALGENFYAVQNDCLRLGKLLVCGSRLWQFSAEEEDVKILEREKIRLQLSLDKMCAMRIEGDKAVVMCHYPPFNVRFEDSEYTRLIAAAGADAVVYGHLHGKGVRAERAVRKNGIPYFLTSCDLTDNSLTEILALPDEE